MDPIDTGTDVGVEATGRTGAGATTGLDVALEDTEAAAAGAVFVFVAVSFGALLGTGSSSSESYNTSGLSGVPKPDIRIVGLGLLIPFMASANELVETGGGGAARFCAMV